MSAEFALGLNKDKDDAVIHEDEMDEEEKIFLSKYFDSEVKGK